MALVETFNLGETVVRMHDDYYKDKSKEEVKEILDKVAQIAYTYLYTRDKGR